MVTTDDPNGEPKGVVGCYRQQSEVLFVSEFSTPEALADPSSSHTPPSEVGRLQKLVLVQRDQSVREFRIWPAVKAEDGGLLVDCEARLGHFFCVPCRQRFVVKHTFLRHLLAVHPNHSLDRVQTADVFLLMADSSLAQGELEAKPEESPAGGSLFDRLFGEQPPRLTPPAALAPAPFAFGAEKFSGGSQALIGAPASQSSMQTGELHGDQFLQCLICGNFCTDSPAAMCDHLEADRGAPQAGDVTMVNGFYYCHLCPYNTTLKANFQLHTRTDKHLQRVQLMNHLREGSSSLTPGAVICRLGAVKSVVQVRCRPCQDVLTCAASIREHCESRAHLSRLAFLSAVGPAHGHAKTGRASAHVVNEMPLNPPVPVSIQTLFECRKCAFKSANAADAHAHKSAAHPLVADDEKPNGDVGGNPQEPLDCTTTAPFRWTPEVEPLVAMREVAFYCKKCDFLSNTLEGLQNHEKVGDHNAKPAEQSTDESCPLCVQKVPALRQHLLEEHNIANEVAETLMASSVASTSSIGGGKETLIGGIYRHRCPCCPLIFKHDDQLRSHELTHTFRVTHKCPSCAQSFQSLSAVLQHQQEEHKADGDLRCKLCNVGFADRSALTAHSTGVEHLTRAKQFLQEQNSQQLPLSDKVLQLLQRRSPATLTSESNAPSPHRPFRCNVCCQGYSQGSTLDIHLRSVAHQTRMNRLNELVAAGEVDPQRPVSEQPGGLPQKKIAELVDSDEKTAAHAPMTNENPLALLNAFNVAQFLQLAQQSSGTAGSSEENADQRTAFGSQSNEAEGGGLDLAALFEKRPVESAKPKERPGAELRRALEGYGLDLVAQLAGDFDTRKIEFVAAEKAADLRQQFREITGDSAPVEAIHAFAENLRAACDLVPDEVLEADEKEEDGSTSPPAAKRHRSSDSAKSSTSSTPRSRLPNAEGGELMSLMGGMPFGGPPGANPFMSQEMIQAAFASMMPGFSTAGGLPNALADPRADQSLQKRARTRITDDQLKILRQYFDINNSPTEQQVKEMSIKAQLPEKVIKHWFRNTLFKERQRDKNSPYNFSVPAMMRIDLDTYEKTGEAKIIPLKEEGENEEEAASNGPEAKATTSTNDADGENREVSPSNSSTHSSATTPATTTSGQGSDLVANFNKAAFAAAAAAGMAAFGQSTPEFPAMAPSNPFAALFNSGAMNSEENPFAQMLQGFAAASNGTSTAAPPASLSASNRAAHPPAQTAAPAASAAGGSGRRANRTRFTDFQLRTLQDFFERQAYPKDDDLEMLSKKLTLTPRIITVWFQNQRQKARKVYENLPSGDQNERFLRTPGSNYQCKRCQLVFQRYYELIQHQQRLCYVNDADAQQTDNRSLDDRLGSEERRSGGRADDEASGVDENSTGGEATADNNNSTNDLLQLLTKSNGDALLKMFKTSSESTETPKFFKRCPFCGFLGHSRDLLLEHLSSKHADNVLVAAIDVDALPEAEESAAGGGLSSTTEELLGKISALTGGTSPLDLRLGASAPFPWDSAAQNDGNRSTSSPTFSEDPDGSRGPDALNDFSSAASFDLRALSTSPGALLSAFGSPLGAAFNNSAASLHSQQRSSANAASSGSSKRYRTHLTPLQVYVMKSLFVDYKTPSMGECEVLGREIGLHKRVEEGLSTTTPSGCEMCGVEFNGRTTVQDHIFTLQHIGKVKERGAALRGTTGEENAAANPPPADSRPPARGVQRGRQATAAGGADDLPFNPLNLVYSTLLDPNVVGTPIKMLQIPEAVQNQIAADLRDGRTSTKFSQDGLEIAELATAVAAEDFRCASITESEVGWGCPQCSNVFQQEALLKNHQKFICTGCEGVFRLIQRHYECVPCAIKFGTQADFKAHCKEASHRANRAMPLPPQLFPALSAATSSSSATC